MSSYCNSQVCLSINDLKAHQQSFEAKNLLTFNENISKCVLLQRATELVIVEQILKKILYTYLKE